jgi:hypothetical protein
MLGSAHTSVVHSLPPPPITRLHRAEVCFSLEDRRRFVERFKAAVVRRRSAEALLRHRLYVASMPVSHALTGSLSRDQGARVGGVGHKTPIRKHFCIRGLHA